MNILDGVTGIGEWAFARCYSLENVSIPDSVTCIGEYAFGECYSRINVHITNLGAWCNIDFHPINSNPFSHGGDLYLNGELVTDLILPDGVTEIKDYAFYGCNSFTKLTIPSSVTRIGDYAFANCNQIQSVFYQGAEDGWNSISVGEFNSALTNATINFIKSKTETKLSNNGKSFTITPINIETGKTVILALYNGGRFVEFQKAIYEGEEITFTTDKTYTDAKVMVWNDLTNLKPVCSVEELN